MEIPISEPRTNAVDFINIPEINPAAPEKSPAKNPAGFPTGFMACSGYVQIFFLIGIRITLPFLSAAILAARWPPCLRLTFSV